MGLLQLEANADDHGRNLAKELADASKPLPEGAPEPVTILRIGETARWIAAVDERYKLVLSINDDPWLFDGSKDPDELENFYGRPGTEKVCARLAESLRDYGEKYNDPHLENPKIKTSLAKIIAE